MAKASRRVLTPVQSLLKDDKTQENDEEVDTPTHQIQERSRNNTEWSGEELQEPTAVKNPDKPREISAFHGRFWGRLAFAVVVLLVALAVVPPALLLLPSKAAVAPSVPVEGQPWGHGYKVAPSTAFEPTEFEADFIQRRSSQPLIEQSGSQKWGHGYKVASAAALQQADLESLAVQRQPSEPVKGSGRQMWGHGHKVVSSVALQQMESETPFIQRRSSEPVADGEVKQKWGHGYKVAPTAAPASVLQDLDDAEDDTPFVRLPSKALEEESGNQAWGHGYKVAPSTAPQQAKGEAPLTHREAGEPIACVPSGEQTWGHGYKVAPCQTKCS